MDILKPGHLPLRCQFRLAFSPHIEVVWASAQDASGMPPLSRCFRNFQPGRGLGTCSRGYISILAQEELWNWRNAAGKKEVWHQRNPSSVRKRMGGLFSSPQQLLPAHYYHLCCPTATKSFSLYPTKASLFSPFAPLYSTHVLFWHHYYQSFLTFCPSLTRPFSQVHLAPNVPL